MTQTDRSKVYRIHYSRSHRSLEITFLDQTFQLSAEFLRVHSPSAEVQGHGPGEQRLQSGKLRVCIEEIKPVGRYAIQLSFDDGHDSGLFSWSYLRNLCENQSNLWQTYLIQLSNARLSRDPEVQTIHFEP